MNAITPITDSLPEKPISPVLSPDLKSLLVEEDNQRWAIQAIIDSPDLKAEAEAALPVLKAAATQKAGQGGVRQVIGKRFALYPQPQRSEGEWAAWWADYFDVLADVHWHALEAGMATYVRDPGSEFMPKPGKLLELARTAPVRVVRAYERAREAVTYRPPPPPLDPALLAELHGQDFPQPKAMADALEIKRMGEEAMRDIRGAKTALPTVELPSIAGKADEGGLTPTMRALLARQRGEG